MTDHDSSPTLSRRSVLGKGLAALLAAATAGEALARGVSQADDAASPLSQIKTLDGGELARMNPNLASNESMAMASPDDKSSSKDNSSKDKSSSSKDKSTKDKSTKDKSTKDKSTKDKSTKDKSTGKDKSTKDKSTSKGA